jgi:CTP synthase
LTEAGLIVAGTQPETGLVEIIELPPQAHPWFVGVQFHPEFLSRPNRPHPLFRDFIGSALQYAKENSL